MLEVDRRKGWWTPWEIIFIWEQIVWLISWLNVLERGEWPPIPQGEVVAKHSKPKGRAYFETAAQIYAEITTRLDRCGQDGEMVKDIYLWGKSDREMCVGYKLDDAEEIGRRVRRALRYIVGWRRKIRTYEDFTSHPKSAKFLPAARMGGRTN